MSTSPAREPIPEPGSGLVNFTACGEQALDDLAGQLAGECDGTTESITSLIERVLTSDVGDLAATLDIAGPGTRSRDPREPLDGIEVDETTPGDSPDEAARRLQSHQADGHARPPTLRRQPAGPDR